MAKFVFRKKENMTISKPMYFAIGLLVVLLIIAILYFIFLKYSPIMNFKYEGYAISGKEITENLLAASVENDSSRSKNIELTKIEEQGTIFKKLNDYFVGNKEKTEINLNYPIYINGNSSLYNLSEGSTLISKDFEEVGSYPNLSISEGKIYDGNNLERADAKEYIFVKTTDNIYINLYEIKIKTTANEYKIPVNSIIAFNENEIRYYSINNNVLIFNQINDIDNNSNVQMIENNYTYKELLTRLGILQDESNSTVDIEGAQTDIIQENTASENNTNNDEKQNEETDEYTSEDQNGYTKPEVTAENFTAEVYTAKSTLYIKDPSGMIIEAPTFEIYKDGKIYLRRTFSNSGEIQITGLIPDTEYEVIGKYIYLNENNQKVENTFYEGIFTTKGYEELGSIDIQKENGEIFSNKIQLTKVKITSDLNAEVLKGVNQVELETGEIRTVLKNSQVNELLQGKEITIESSEGLKSDSKIKYVVKFYDNNGVELKVNNNEGETRTSKEAPTVRVSLKEQDIVNVTLGLKLTNRDNVELENYKYVVTRPNGEVVQEKKLSENETELLLEDLDQNQYYKISIYADYDLNDNRGKQEQIEIGNLVFATQPISTLGSLELTVENKELTSTTSTISYKINEDRTDKRLIQILNELTINIVEQPEDYDTGNSDQKTKEGTIVYTDVLTGEEITNLQQAGIKEIKYENLKSNTTYTIEITGNIELGNTQEEIPITYNYKEFTTLKIPAKVEIQNQFVTGSLIDFDVRIEDIDNSVLNNKVRMELRSSSNDLIDLQELTTNEDYIRKTYEKLEENQTYTLRFYADQYNEGSTDETYKANYLIKEIEIITEPGISGSIGLTELSRKATGKNLVDMSSETKWYVYPNFNTGDYYGKEYNEEKKILKLGGNNNYRRAVYDLREYAGQEVTMSFKAKAGSNSQNVYIQNSKTGTNMTKIEGLITEWKDFQYTLTVDSTGYLGFFIDSGNGIEIKELQIELGNKKTSYEEFKYTLQSNYSVNLEDRRDEITTNDYYLKIYENDNLVKTDRYEEIPENNIVENATKTYESNSDKCYKIQLVIKIKDREYVLSELEYNTDKAKEIKGIYSVEDFKEIQPNGNYILLNELDLTKESIYFGGRYLSFDGNINFNGMPVDLKINNSNNKLFYKISEKGLIENLVLNIHLPDAAVSYYGAGAIFVQNYGNIKNIQVNVVEAYNQPYTYVSGLIGWENMGTIDGFVVNYEKIIYGNEQFSLINTSYGSIKNGYIYGKSIENYTNSASNSAFTPFLKTNQAAGRVENVFVLNSTKISTENAPSNAEANFTISNYGTLNNIYSVDLNNDSTILRGPNVSTNNATVTNSYYFSNNIYTNSIDIKSSELALYDTEFQNQIINSENRFNTSELIEKGYFPQLNFDKCMPAQSYIELPAKKDEDLADITSIEVLEKTNDTAKVKFVVNNKNAENISKIEIENVNCIINSQEYSNGKSEVIATLEEPKAYLSTYGILSITTKGVLNLEYTRQYEEGERNIYIDFYKEINKISDWEEMKKSPIENYILMQDLDFMNQTTNIIITNEFKGKLEGNSHTIRNVNIPTNYKALFNSLTGSISNLTIENYKQSINGSGNFGFVMQANRNSKIDNVHIKNMEITKTDSTEVVFGGIVGQANYSSVKNSSVTNESIQIVIYIDNITIGGIMGRSTYSNIENCFTQDLDIEVTNALTLKGIGGILGVNSAGSVSNSYSTGKIKANKEYVGGIVGYNTHTVNKCFSTVNLESTAGYVGGIIGYTAFIPGDTNTENPVKYNLYLGNIYTATDISNRIAGNGSMGKENFGYENQKVTGIEISSEGIELLSYSEIFNIATYIDKLLWTDSYDYSSLTNNILPKLKNTNTGEVIPNQADIKLLTGEFVVQNIEIQKNSNSIAQIRLEFTNPNNLPITEITIEGLENTITRNANSNGMTYIDMQVTPTRYWDNYKLSEIWYITNGEKQKEDMSEQIELQFFKEINNYLDWQDIDDTSAENYTLMTDIDFSGRAINTNLSIGRLEGNNHTLRNINVSIETSGGFIKEVKNSLKNLTFSNVNITNSTSGNYIGVIGNNAAELENITFEDIVIYAPKRSYVACIANSTSDKITNITLNNIKVTGISYVAGCITNTNEKDITNITADNVTVVASGNYAGGIIGYTSWTDYYLQQSIQYLTVKNSNIKGVSYVGGVLGYGRINHMDSINNQVSGASYVGGVTGFAYTVNGNSTTTNCIIQGSGNNIGGIAGYHDGLSNVKVYNSKIYGTSANAIKVGGIVGDSGANVSYGLVIDSIVSSLGSQVGGISGFRGATYCAVINTTIDGYSEVGGLVGRLDSYSSTISNSYTNATVTATAHSAGGIAGYIHNEFDISVRSSIVQTSGVFGSNVSGNSNVGGLIGQVDIAVDTSKYYSNYVHANISGEEESISLGIGSNPNYNLAINKLFAYKYSTVNSKIIDENDEIFIPAENFLDANELKVSTTYSSRIGWSTGVWNFNTLENNCYPNLKATSLGEQQGIELPNDEINVDNMQIQDEVVEQTFEYAGKQITTYSDYSIIEDAEGNSVKRDTKLYLKDGNLFVLSPDMNMVDGNFIIDNYNGKEYETVLGTDGKVYDLKEKLTYPENFKNEDIKSIGNNLDTEEKEVEVTYNYGDKIKFNYQTGEIISEEKLDENKTGLIEFIQDKLTTKEDAITTNEEGYEDTKELIQKLEEVPVEKAEEMQNNNEQQENQSESQNTNSTNYITTYNTTSDRYEIYNEEELLNTTKQTVETENEKIAKNDLSSFYSAQISKAPEESGKTTIYIIILAVFIVLAILIRYNINKKQTN